jgi:hypothetical protein
LYPVKVLHLFFFEIMAVCQNIYLTTWKQERQLPQNLFQARSKSVLVGGNPYGKWWFIVPEPISDKNTGH